MKNGKSKTQNLGNLGNIIPSFLISEYLILAVGQKIPETSEASEFLTWPETRSVLNMIGFMLHIKIFPDDHFPIKYLVT